MTIYLSTINSNGEHICIPMPDDYDPILASEQSYNTLHDPWDDVSDLEIELMLLIGEYSFDYDDDQDFLIMYGHIPYC